jgi:hypothetical protein
MTPLHHVGDAVRDALASLPLGLVRVLFLALPVLVLVWVLRLPAEQANLPGGRWDTNLKVGAAIALLIQIGIYLVL